jgi:hypothetical protein
MAVERDSMTLKGLPAPVLGVEERSGEAPSAGASAPPARPDPEVVSKPRRRQFTAEYRLRILEEADRCLKNAFSRGHPEETRHEHRTHTDPRWLRGHHGRESGRPPQGGTSSSTTARSSKWLLESTGRPVRSSTPPTRSSCRDSWIRIVTSGRRRCGASRPTGP